MEQDLKPILLVTPLTLAAEYNSVIDIELSLDCNNSGTVSCGQPGRVRE